jgi:CheY-like chemotaxis protein
VAVESAVGQGSCFTVWVPIRSRQDVDATVVTGEFAATCGEPAGPRTALVVESNFRSAEVIRVQLEAEGFKVLHASTADEAMAIAQRESLCLITLDIMMPDVDGWHFLEELKAHEGLRNVPVVILSILADRTRGFALGAAAVMQSPVSRQELYDILVKLGLSPLSGDRSIRVLVVDDDPKSVELIAMRIRTMASETLRAYGGREGIEIAKRELPDLIVLDLMMPEVNGFDVVEALGADPSTAAIPIVIVTASTLTPAERQRLNGFVSTVLGKVGFDNHQFMTEVRRALAGRPAAA